MFTVIRCKDGKKNSIPRLLFNSNRAAVIRSQFLIQTLIGAFIFNKMNAFLKLKFQIIDSLMSSKGVRFARNDCNNNELYCNCTNDKIPTSTCLGLSCNFSSLDRQLFVTINFVTIRDCSTTIHRYSRLFAIRVFQTPLRTLVRSDS